ncbi:hypothetical protein CALCODRAFT_238116 [Calocera cornea HHB12733]|uniref:DNA mismatch repair proteins mutS family domain-containing protein n=1 Tax=Calocera cornea HHB12733 TaxID=1353952 RepID=A0A165GSD0_9BASI|nr:hypothetical protein CALCODRAFT_238116 [Calocera cornea HHB12733]
MRCLARRNTVSLTRSTCFASCRSYAKAVTKTKYEELPSVYTLPDGTEATPLAELHSLVQITRSRRRIFQDISDPDDGPVPRRKFASPTAALSASVSTDIGIGAPADPDTIPEVLTITQDESDVLTETPSSDSAAAEPPVPKRKRRRKKSEEDSAALAESASQSVTVEGEVVLPTDVQNGVTESIYRANTSEAVPKPKRRRRKVILDESQQDEDEPTQSPDVDKAIPYTNLAREIQQNMLRFPHCILLTRVGQFYESYFHQAPILASLVDIKLTSRAWGQKGTRVHMCGFPLSHLDRHLKTLVQQHKRFVAMCEEFPRPPGSEPGFDRRVTRVVTPGTLIDESFLNQYENNYLLAIGRSRDIPTLDIPEAKHTDGEYGLAWIDVSTGEFFTQPTSVSTLRNDISRIAPKEVVLHDSMKGASGQAVREMIGEELGWISYISPEEVEASTPDDSQIPATQDNTKIILSNQEDTSRLLSNDASDEAEPPRTESDDVPSSPTAVPIVDDAFTPSESIAVDLLTAFLRTHLLELMPRLSAPIREAHEERMQIDSHTIKALEIREGMIEGGVTGSLLSVVKRTMTTSGTRLLARWLCSPSTSLGQINARQSLVALFHTRPHLRSDLEEFLYQIEDASRIVQKFLLGRGDANDLLAIRDTINVTEQIKTRILQERDLELQSNVERAEEWNNVNILLDRMRDLRPLAERIDNAVDESEFRRQERAALGAPREEDDEPIGGSAVPIHSPSPKTDVIVWTMKSDFSPELQHLHKHLASLQTRKDEMELELKQEFSAPSLQLKTSFNHGLHIRIGNPRRDSRKIGESDTMVLIGQSASSKSFFHRPWSRLGAEIATTEQSIQQAERRAFESLRSEVNSHATSLRRNARIVDEIDVTIGFANAAHELRLIRPEMNDGLTYHVHNGRHPTVELGLLDAGRVFTPNSVKLWPSSRLHVITGPNMAGKSTLLRQTALIAILAQTGSYVPADRAEIGIVDKVFSRVGAKDDLFRDRSTFMVEMLETAEILRSATWRSLVIMDEVGRGTTVADGLAIAFATVNHLYHVNRCRTLFATHFHELADMLGYVDPPSTSAAALSAPPAGAHTSEPEPEPEPEPEQRAFPQLGFYHTSVDSLPDGRFAYSHRLRAGVNRDSHGLKVAQLAGMPEGAVGVAGEALGWLRARGGEAEGERRALRRLGRELAGRAQRELLGSAEKEQLSPLQRSAEGSL